MRRFDTSILGPLLAGEERLVMRPIARAITVPLAMVLLAAPAGAAGPLAGALKKCPADSVCPSPAEKEAP